MSSSLTLRRVQVPGNRSVYQLPGQRMAKPSSVASPITSSEYGPLPRKILVVLYYARVIMRSISLPSHTFSLSSFVSFTLLVFSKHFEGCPSASFCLRAVLYCKRLPNKPIPTWISERFLSCFWLTLAILSAPPRRRPQRRELH